MGKAKGELRLMVDDFKNQVRGMGKDMAESMGNIGEEVSNKDQMAAFDAMTPQDWVQLSQRKSPQEISKFVREMLRRKELQDANRQPT